MILDPALLGIAGGSFAGRTESLVLVPIFGGPRIHIAAPARGWTNAVLRSVLERRLEAADVDAYLGEQWIAASMA